MGNKNGSAAIRRLFVLSYSYHLFRCATGKKTRQDKRKIRQSVGKGTGEKASKHEEVEAPKKMPRQVAIALYKETFSKEETRQGHQKKDRIPGIRGWSRAKRVPAKEFLF